MQLRQRYNLDSATVETVNRKTRGKGKLMRARKEALQALQPRAVTKKRKNCRSVPGTCERELVKKHPFSQP